MPGNIFNGLCQGQYTVYASDGACTDSVVVNITEPATLSIPAVITDASCSGNGDGKVVVTPQGGTPPYSYAWTVGSAGNLPVDSNLSAGPVTVTVTDANGCFLDSTFTIGISGSLSLDTIVSNVNCFGACDGSIELIAIGGATSYSIDGINWVPGNIFSNLCIGQYQLYATNGACTDSIVVNITEPISMSIPGVVTDATCFGYNDGQVVVAPQGGLPPYSYAWSSVFGGSSAVSNNLPAGPVTVTVTDANGCVLDSTFIVGEPASLNLVSFTGDTLAGCSPLQVNFSNTTNPTLFTSILWEFGNGETSTIDPATTTFTAPGDYNVKLTITNAIGCVGVLEEVAFVTVYEDPVAHFSTTQGDVTVFDPTFDFNDLSYYNIVSWNWDFNNLGTSSLQHPSFTFPDDTASHNITLTVVDNHGCTNTVNYTVKVKGEHAIFVPNAFTPDFDGQNDGFRPYGFGILPTGYSFLIFNRWGEQVFESNKIETAWFGDYKGNLVPLGTYVWRIEFMDTNGHLHKETGKVNVIR